MSRLHGGLTTNANRQLEYLASCPNDIPVHRNISWRCSDVDGILSKYNSGSVANLLAVWDEKHRHCACLLVYRPILEIWSEVVLTFSACLWEPIQSLLIPVTLFEIRNAYEHQSRTRSMIDLDASDKHIRWPYPRLSQFHVHVSIQVLANRCLCNIQTILLHASWYTYRPVLPASE